MLRKEIYKAAALLLILAMSTAISGFVPSADSGGKPDAAETETMEDAELVGTSEAAADVQTYVGDAEISISTSEPSVQTQEQTENMQAETLPQEEQSTETAADNTAVPENTESLAPSADAAEELNSASTSDVSDVPVNTDIQQNASENSDSEVISDFIPEVSVMPESVTENSVSPTEQIPHQPENSVPEEESVLDESAVQTENGVLLDVPYINQRKNYPNGCESVSAVMALQYMGVDITPNDFIENYLDMGLSPYWKGGKMYSCDPRVQFPGDPRNNSGWGCYPEVIKKAIDKMELEDQSAFVLKDAALSTLCREYIDNGIPVVFWGTIDMKKPSSYVTWNIEGTDKTHTWTTPFHCLLLVGYDDEYYYFNDPWRQKNQKYTKEQVEIAYSGMGREALVIVGNSKN